MIKRAYSAKMVFDIPDSEKRVAEKASEAFEDLVSLIKFCNNHLDLIYQPFKKIQKSNTDVMKKNEMVLARYAKAVRHNFNLLIKKSNNCAVLMSTFATDSKTQTLMKSFLTYADEIKKESDRLCDVLDDYQNTEFPVNLVNAIDFLKKTCIQLKQLINDRILEFIDSDILTKDLINDITDENNQKIYNKTPLLIQLYEERAKAL